jgi:prophage antirepressor-like protein
MPDARRFKRWVTSEILPSLRKRGCYAIDEETIVRHYFSFRSDAEIEQIVTALKEIDKMNQTCKLQD